MKKVLIILIVLTALFVSCENGLMEELMSSCEIELTCIDDNGLWLASFTGTTPTDYYDEVALTFDQSGDVVLVENCLGNFAGHAKKVIIPSSVVYIESNAFNDSYITEIEMLSSATDFSEAAFTGCSNLELVTKEGQTVFPE